MWDWDDAKRRANRAKHGIDFTEVERLDWADAEHQPDDRRDYGEARIVTLGMIDGRLHVLTWTPRAGRVRVINLRKANAREQAAFRTLKAPH